MDQSFLLFVLGFETSSFLYSVVKNEFTHVLPRTQHNIVNDHSLLPFGPLKVTLTQLYIQQVHRVETARVPL